MLLPQKLKSETRRRELFASGGKRLQKCLCLGKIKSTAQGNIPAGHQYSKHMKAMMHVMSAKKAECETGKSENHLGIMSTGEKY